MNEKKESLIGFEYRPKNGLERQVVAEFKEDFVDVEEVKEEEKMKEGEEKKEESTEQKKERYIDILVRIGFLKGKEKGDGKERYYYKINDNSAVGRTFDSRTPLGKFWAKINGEWLKDKECKEVEIIKRFYAIRGGEEEMPEKKEEEKKEIAVRENEVVVEIKPNAVVQDAQIKADMLYSVVERQHLYQEIRGKKYLQLEAWQTLGKFCNVTGEIEWVKPVEMWDARGFEARAVIKTVELTRNEQGGTTTKVGDTIAVAESMCMNDEENWQGKPMFQLKSMCQTRALSKAYRSCLSFIVALAGYAATPLEEM